MNEEWKDIEGHSGLYAISSFGRVLNKQTNKYLVGDVNNIGYCRVNLSNPNKRYFVHQLVAKHFVPGWFEGAVVNHLDGNKQNNRSDNLEWTTHSENDKHAFRLGLRKPTKGGNKTYYRVEVFDIETGERLFLFQNRFEFAERFNRSPSFVGEMIAHGSFFEKPKTHTGKQYGIRWDK